MYEFSTTSFCSTGFYHYKNCVSPNGQTDFSHTSFGKIHSMTRYKTNYSIRSYLQTNLVFYYNIKSSSQHFYFLQTCLQTNLYCNIDSRPTLIVQLLFSAFLVLAFFYRSRKPQICQKLHPSLI